MNRIHTEFGETRRRFRAKVIFVLTMVAVIGASVASPTPFPKPSIAQKTPEQACGGPEFHQFDFWIGSWLVKRPDGKEAGRSKITRVANGCAIREEWSGAGGTVGTSLNYYQSKDAKWHQDWVGGDGTILHLSGGLEGSLMTLAGEHRDASGHQLDRISWMPMAGGKVKQEWTISIDEGKTWKSIFAGLYERLP